MSAMLNEIGHVQQSHFSLMASADAGMPDGGTAFMREMEHASDRDGSIGSSETSWTDSWGEPDEFPEPLTEEKLYELLSDSERKRATHSRMNWVCKRSCPRLAVKMANSMNGLLLRELIDLLTNEK